MSDQLEVLRDEADFWFRRFVTQLAVANGAGLILSIGLIARTDDASIPKIVPVLFALGAIVAAAYPIFRWAICRISFERQIDILSPHADYEIRSRINTLSLAIFALSLGPFFLAGGLLLYFL